MRESYKHIARQARRSIDVCALHGVRIEAAESIVEKLTAAGYLSASDEFAAPAAAVAPAASEQTPQDNEETGRLTAQLEALWKQLPELTIKEQTANQGDLDKLLLALDESFKRKNGTSL